MKTAIVIPDGCADEPQEPLGHRTPLQAAHLPNMDAIARLGLVGLSNNVPPTLTPASDVATLSLLGYDPLEVYTGRAPLEAAAMGIALGPLDWAVRCNLVHLDKEEMRDFTAGHISSDEGRTLVGLLSAELAGPASRLVPGMAGRIEFHPGVSYRNLMVYRGEGPSPFDAATRTQPPHDIADKAVSSNLPSGPGSGLLRAVMERSRAILAPTMKRDKAATQAWLWGQGKAPTLKPFIDLYGKRGAMLSAVDLVRGVGTLAGWKRIDVPGATGYLDTDYAAKGRYGVAALEDHDIVCVHVEAPDEASHEGRADEKVKALERIDEHVVGPLLAALRGYPAWRLLVSPDHRTTLRTRGHAHGPVPFALAGTGIGAFGFASYDEQSAAGSPFVHERGHELMKRLLASV
ncbi:MAG: cofactor-independent phosphoglycerate mutase [Gemmataceae bacterium]|nr:cofactor-independent phosphoglycerate mutase [Gemmataceae bacterium]